MRKLFLAIITLTIGLLAKAQQDTTLAQYTGKFTFPDGSIVSEVNITIENGILYANSVMGGSELRKGAEADVFEIVAYNGTATFRRKEGKISGIQIIAGDVILEGTKSETQQGGIACSPFMGILPKTSLTTPNRR